MNHDEDDERRGERLGRSLYEVQLPRHAAWGSRPACDAGSPAAPPHSVWLRPPGALAAAPFADSDLPAWALERIAAQFASPGAWLGVCHGPGPARTGLHAVPDVRWAPGWLTGGGLYANGDQLPVLDLALVLAEPFPHEPAPTGEVTGPFWRALRQTVRPGGIVLVHTRARNDDGTLNDPLGTLTRDATRCGLGYLQHHVLVHTALLTEPLGAADPAVRDRPGDKPAHRIVHSDLLAFRVPA